MIHKETAEYLVNQFVKEGIQRIQAIACAKICVDQILKLSGLPQYQIIFWKEVKTEIEKL